MHDYFFRAIAACVIVGVLCGLVGTLVVLRRRVFFTVAIGHAAFPGAVAASIIGWPVWVGAGVGSIALVGVMNALGRVRRQGEEAISGIIFTGGFALGIAIASLAPSSATQVESLLTGSILTLPDETLITLAVWTLIVAVLLLLLRRRILFSTVDAIGYGAAGFSERRLDAGLLAVIAISVALLIPALGTMLSVALLAGPAASALLLTKKWERMVPLTVAGSALCALAGLFASRWFGFAAGGSIAVAAAGLYLVALTLRAVGVGKGSTRVLGARADRESAEDDQESRVTMGARSAVGGANA